MTNSEKPIRTCDDPRGPWDWFPLVGLLLILAELLHELLKS